MKLGRPLNPRTGTSRRSRPATFGRTDRSAGMPLVGSKNANFLPPQNQVKQTMTEKLGEPFEVEDEDWEDIKARCEAAGIDYEERVMPSALGDSTKPKRRQISRSLTFPAGKSTRRVLLFPSDLKDFRTIEFEHYTFLGDYSAIWNTQTDAIEAGLTLEYPRVPVNRIIRRIANFENLDPPESSDDNSGEKEVEEVPDSGIGDTRIRVDRMPNNWRILLTGESASIELSPSSVAFRQMANEPRSTAMTLKLSGINYESYDQALQSLQDIGNALTFELDVRNNVQLILARTRIPGTPSPSRIIGKLPARFPASTYPQEPLELYQYGRSAAGLPLLQFLAYYQVVEFFFPIFSRQEVTRRLRIALKQPRFDVNDDIALNRVLSTILPEGRTGIGEREQLRLTLRGCLEPGAIKEFIESSPEYGPHFTGKSQVIRGAGRILLHDGQPDLRDQAADRIYAIRCRVVHTKQDGTDSAVELLLPSSPEARSMAPDVELMRLAAQHVIASAGQTLRLS